MMMDENYGPVKTISNALVSAANLDKHQWETLSVKSIPDTIRSAIGVLEQLNENHLPRVDFNDSARIVREINTISAMIAYLSGKHNFFSISDVLRFGDSLGEVSTQLRIDETFLVHAFINRINELCVALERQAIFFNK